MPPIDKEIVEIIDVIMAHAGTLFKASTAIIIIMGLYNVLKTLVAYVAFRANRDIGKNVKLVVKDREAIITHFTMRYIHIRFKDNKNEMIIPMRRWENMDWEIIKNGYSAPAEQK
jgi:hypothetical protein